MLQKDKNYDQTKFSCRQITVDGEVWYRLELLQETEIEQTEPEKCYPTPTIEERVGVLEEFYAIMVRLEKITLEDVPEKYRPDVEKLLN